MRKNVLVLAAVITAALCALPLSGCGCSSSDSGSSDNDSNQTAVANPVYETDEQGAFDATGFDLVAPQGTENPAWSYIDSGNGNPMAQLTFTLDGIDWTYRAQYSSAVKIEDVDATALSGVYDEWTETKDTTVNNRSGKICLGKDSGLIYWLDAVPGVEYSLYASSSVTEDQLKSMAEQIFVPTQGED